MPLDSDFETLASIPASVTGATLPGPAPAVLEFVHPLTKDVTRIEAPEGATIAEMLAAAGVNHRRWGAGWCTIEDGARTEEPAFIDRQYWARVRPKAGTIATVSLWPGRGGSGGGKNILGVILAVVISVVAIAVAPYLASVVGPLIGVTAGSTGAALLTAAIAATINIVGNLILTALIPPQKLRPVEDRLAGLAEDRAGFHLQGASNRARPYQPIPLHLGRLRRFADLGAEFFTEVAGNEQYLRFFMPWGLGPLKVSELKIGETPIEDHDGVETRTVEGWPDDGPPEIFANDPHTEGLSIELSAAAGWQTRTTTAGIDEFQVEIAFPGGLGQGTGDARINPISVEFDAEAAPAGTEDWAAIAWFNDDEPGFETPGKILATDATRIGQPRRVGRAKPDAGGNPAKQWRVRVRRSSADSTNPLHFDVAFWAALKSIAYVLPIGEHLVGKIAYTEGRIKATGQLNGVIQELNAIVESYVREFDENGFLGSWAVPRTNWIVSRNNAELLAHVLAHQTRRKPLAEGRINWLNMVEWRDACAAPAQDGEPYWMYDRVWENRSTAGAIADEIASAGRARRGMVAGKHGVIRDVPQSTPAQHFTPRNSSGFRTDIVLRPRLHAVRVRYNKDGLGQEAEITVYDDGYDAGNATEIETAEAIGTTRKGQAWRDWRYWLAVQRLRPHGYELGCDAEYLKAGRGALARATHDVVGWGLVSGRVRGFALNGGGDYTSVILDTAVEMEAGKSYGIRIRNPAGSHAATVNTVAGETNTLTFTTAQPSGWAINANDGDQDLFGFGEAGKESVELIVTGVKPGPNLSARLMLADAAPGVHTADTGTIPEFDPQITLPPADARKPDPPSIRTIKSDESVLEQRVGGALVVRFLAEFNPPTGQPVPEYVQARWRPLAASPWTPGSLQPSAGLVYAGVGVQQGVSYRIEFRHVTAKGAASDWVGADHTIVGKTTPPPDVAGLFDEGEHIRWSYPAPPLDVTHGGGFQVKYAFGNAVGVAGAWAAANLAHDDLIAGTNFAKALLPPGEITVLVKAVDADGNESAAAAALFTEVFGPAIANIVESYDFRAAGWPGTIANGTISAGDIIADSASLFWDTVSGPFWSSSEAALFWEATWAPVAYEAVYVPPPAALPARLTLAITASGTPQRHLYRIDDREFWALFGDGAGGGTFWGADEDLFWAPGSAPAWRDWPGFLDLEEDAPIEVRIEAGGGPSEGQITALTATLDAEDVSELLLDVAIAPGGTALPVTETFRRFVHVADLALLDDGGAARGVRIKSALPSDTAPVVECLDASGASTAGHVNARPQGY